MAQRGVNKVILVGNLGNDPETRYTPDNRAITTISLATSETWLDKQNGQQQERTEWHRVVFFGKLAEIAGEYLRKGSKVYIEGKLQTRKWQDQSGADRYSTEVVVDQRGTMQMLDSRNDGSGGFNNQNNQGGGYQQNNNQQANQGGGYQQNNQASGGYQQNQGSQQSGQQGGGQQAAPQSGQQGGAQTQSSPAPSNDGFDDSFDDDIPF